jgi:hypothetical protein
MKVTVTLKKGTAKGTCSSSSLHSLKVEAFVHLWDPEQAPRQKSPSSFSNYSLLLSLSTPNSLVIRTKAAETVTNPVTLGLWRGFLVTVRAAEATQ